ncbi:MAG: AsmA-like C-terminal region-containing protein [Vicinamibacterales bacterium]
MSPRPSRRIVWVLVAVGLVAFGVSVTVLFLARIPFSVDALRDRVTEGLEERLDSDVELGSLTLRVLPAFRAEGTNLVIRHRRMPDMPPLITVRGFTVEADLGGLFRRNVRRVTLDGLEIQIPPGEARRTLTGDSGDSDTSEPGTSNGVGDSAENDVLVEELIAEDAKVIFVPRDPEKPPKTWEIHDLRMTDVGAHSAMPFTATVTNAVPPGEIETSGSFGPWETDDPGQTPLSGAFTFTEADLSVFKGISGILSAVGTYGGNLGSIEVQGTTDTPDFAVTVGSSPVHLQATYLAIVNGTDGNTRLEHIDARFLDTRILAVGDVRHTPERKGREVVLDLTLEDSRLEDVLRLAVNTPEPPMTGALEMQTAFRLPPGDQEVVRKLELDGVFNIDGGRFTNAEVQQRINGLSQRARGQQQEEGTMPARVTSDFSGTFELGNGALSLTPVTFDIPGAIVELSGRYGLQRETLAFRGNLYMDAKVSQTTTGLKSLALRLIDPLFRRNGRTVVPLNVEGTRSDPQFGLDMRRVFRR